MERKIGEIFEYNGEWCQCVVAMQGCRECFFRTRDYCTHHSECMSTERSDKASVIFKKLEKVGEPYFNGQYGKVLQEYKYYIPPITPDLRIHIIKLWIVGIEIKQNKEDMEEKKTNFVESIDALCKRYNMSDGVRTDFMSELKEIIKDMEEKKLNLKTFDINKAREGKPVCTRDGRKARIICFDAKCDNSPIIALIENGKNEEVHKFHKDGKLFGLDEDEESFKDLMMLPEKKEGWVNVYKNQIHDTPESAEEGHKGITDYIKTIRVEWED